MFSLLSVLLSRGDTGSNAGVARRLRSLPASQEIVKAGAEPRAAVAVGQLEAYDSFAMTRQSRTLWIWMLIVHMSVLAPWVVAADSGSVTGMHSPCADAAHRDASEPCPGCPDSHCADPTCVSLCAASAMAPIEAPAVLSVIGHEAPTPALVPSPAEIAQPPLHPPPILL